MSISQSTLYRRVIALYNLTPHEFIQNIRLKHTERMLKKKIGNVTDIAHALGFNDPKSFTKCFRQYCGITPREILKMNGNINV